MPSPFATMALDTRATARLTLLHPITGRPITTADGAATAFLVLLSWESEEAQAHRLARDNRERLLGRPLTAEEEWDDMGALLARLTTEWSLIGLDGVPLGVPLTYDLAVEAYNSLGLRWMRNQAIAHLNARMAHLPLAGSKPSVPGPDTNSGSAND